MNNPGWQEDNNTALGFCFRRILTVLTLYVVDENYDDSINWKPSTPIKEEKDIKELIKRAEGVYIDRLNIRIRSPGTAVMIRKVYNYLKMKGNYPRWFHNSHTMDAGLYYAIINNKCADKKDYMGHVLDKLNDNHTNNDNSVTEAPSHWLETLRAYIFFKLLTNEEINIKSLTPSYHMNESDAKICSNYIDIILDGEFHGIYKKKFKFINSYTDNEWAMKDLEIYIVDYRTKSTIFRGNIQNACNTNSAIDGREGFFVVDHYSVEGLDMFRTNNLIKEGDYSDFKCSPIDFRQLIVRQF